MLWPFPRVASFKSLVIIHFSVPKLISLLTGGTSCSNMDTKTPTQIFPAANRLGTHVSRPRNVRMPFNIRPPAPADRGRSLQVASLWKDDGISKVKTFMVVVRRWVWVQTPGGGGG